MGTYTNGVYSPAIGEVGWGDEVNDALVQLSSTVNAKSAVYGAIGDNSHDDTTNLQAAITATPEGGQLLIPAGIYKTTGMLTCTRAITIRGAGAATCINRTDAGAGSALKFITGGGATTINGIFAKNFCVKTASAANAIHVVNVNRSRFSNISVLGAPLGAGWYLDGSVLNEFDNCIATVNLTFPIASSSFKYGWVLTNDVASACNINVFNGCMAEGVGVAPGAGLEMRSAIGNKFNGFTTEGNTIGINWNPLIATATRDNWLEAIWFEANGTNMVGFTGNTLRNYISSNGGVGGAMQTWDGTGDNELSGPLIFASAVGTEIARIQANNDTTPEGVYSGNVGDLYMPLAPAVGGELFIKQTGAGTTGWKAVAIERGFSDLSGAVSPIAIDAASASHFGIIRAGTGGFTISNPSNWVAGRIITFSIYNNSGGAINATWAGNYHLATAWTDPGNARARTISFVANASIAANAWQELSRAGGDIS